MQSHLMRLSQEQRVAFLNGLRRIIGERKVKTGWPDDKVSDFDLLICDKTEIERALEEAWKAPAPKQTVP